MFRGIELGRIADVVVDGDGRTIGFAVLCGDDARRFLPYAVAMPKDGLVEMPSPFLLLDAGALEYYLSHGATLAA